MRHAWPIALVLLALLSASAARAGDPSAPGVTAAVHRDLVYGRIGDRELGLDLYLPAVEDGAAAPLVVWVHGGGWRRGSKTGCPVRWLVEEGFAVASVAYRLSDEATFPAQIHDVKGAIRWLRAHADEYAYDPSRIGAAGSSAGGHLVALLGTGAGVRELEGDVGGNASFSSRVQAVYDLYGPTDLTATTDAAHSRDRGPVALLLGGPPAERPDLARLASPVTHVTADDPPFLIVHGTEDRVVPPDQSRRLHLRLQAAGVPSDLVPLDGAGHGGPAFQTPEARARVLAFFRRHLDPDAAFAVTTPPSDPVDRDLSPWARPGPHAVRSLPLLALRDEARGKDLQVRVTWPDDPGLHPVLVFSHGAFGTKDGYAPLVEHWASHGYVVIQANHGDSRVFGLRPLETLFRDEHATRPADVSFLLDHLPGIREAMAGYPGRLDAERIGVGGHSFGAHTAQLLAGVRTRGPGGEGDVSHADPRPKAFLLISPQGRGGELGEDAWRELVRPFCVITGTKDGGRGGQPFLWRLDPYQRAPASRKHLVLVLDGHHGFGGITQGRRSAVAGPQVAGHVDLVKAASLLFWDGYVRDREAAREALRASELSVDTGGRARALFR